MICRESKPTWIQFGFTRKLSSHLEEVEFQVVPVNLLNTIVEKSHEVAMCWEFCGCCDSTFGRLPVSSFRSHRFVSSSLCHFPVSLFFFNLRWRRYEIIISRTCVTFEQTHTQKRFDRPLILPPPDLNKYARYQTIMFTQYVAVKMYPIDVFVATGVMDQRNGKHASNIEPMFHKTHSKHKPNASECVQILSQMLKFRQIMATVPVAIT